MGILGGLAAGFFSFGLGFVVAAICASLCFSLVISCVAAPILTGHLLSGTMSPSAVIGRTFLRWGLVLLSFAAGYGAIADYADFADLINIADAADVADTAELANTAGHFHGNCISEISGDGCGPMDSTYGTPSVVDGDPRVDHWVDSYQREDGTVVVGHWKSKSG